MDWWKTQKSRHLENEIIFPQIKKSLIALLGLYYGEKYFFSGGNLQKILRIWPLYVSVVAMVCLSILNDENFHMTFRFTPNVIAQQSRQNKKSNSDGIYAEA